MFEDDSNKPQEDLLFEVGTLKLAIIKIKEMADSRDVCEDPESLYGLLENISKNCSKFL